MRYSILIVVGLVVTAALLLVFIHWELAQSPNDLVQVASVCIALIALGYTAMTLQQSTSIRAEELRLKKLDYAMTFIERSSMPEMARAFRIVAGLRKKVEGQSPEEVVKLIDDDPDHMESVIMVFNYFERLGIIIRLNAADEQALRDYYISPVQQYWSLFRAWVDEKRRSRGSDTFCEIEYLVNRWGA